MLDQIINALDVSSEKQKILLTPHSINPGLIKRNIALRTEKLCNLKVISFKNYLVELSLKHFTGRTYLDYDERFWFVYGILNSNRDKLAYFKESVEYRGLCSLMCDLIDELRLNSIKEGDLQHLELKDKWNDILFIISEYERLKNEKKFFDYCDAVMVLFNHPEKTENIFAVDFSKTKLENELLKKLFVKVLAVEDTFYYKCEIKTYQVGTPYQEALQTIRNIDQDLKSKFHLKIGICVPDYNQAFYNFNSIIPSEPNEDDTNIFEIASEDNKKKFHFVKGEPFFSTSPGNLWKYISEWALNNFSVFSLIKVLESGHFSFSSLEKQKNKTIETHSFYSAVEYFRRSKLHLFNEHFEKAFGEFLEGRKATDEDGSSESKLNTEAVRIAWLITNAFLPVIKASDPIKKAKALVDVVNIHCMTRSAADNIATSRFSNVAEQILKGGSSIKPFPSFEDVILIVTKKLNDTYVNSSLPDYSRPVIGTADDFAYTQFDKLYCLGMNEKGLPKRVMQNPLLLDYEKEELKDIRSDVLLYMMPDSLKENDQKFYSLLQNVRNEIVFSVPLKDLSSGRDYLVSRYLLDICSRYDKISYDYKTIYHRLNDDKLSANNYISADPENSFYNYEIAVSIITKNSGRRTINRNLSKYFTYANGIAKYKENIRSGNIFNEFWGNVSASPDRELGCLSASAIADWSKCPYMYFLKRELRADQPQDFDANTLEWLSPLEYGNFLHELFDKLFHARGSFKEIVENDRKQFLVEFNELIKKYIKRNPIKSPAYFEIHKNLLKKDAEMFFEREKLNKDERRFAEMPFGETNNVEDPTYGKNIVKLNDNTSVRFSGRIDRVDQCDEVAILIDYKTGTYYPFNEKLPFNGGTLIQAGIYPIIFYQIEPHQKNIIFRYYFSTVKSGFKTVDIDYNTYSEHFMKLLTKIIEQIRKGNFIPSSKSEGDDSRGLCKSCLYTPVCADGRGNLYDRCKRNKNDQAHEEYKSVKEEKC